VTSLMTAFGWEWDLSPGSELDPGEAILVKYQEQQRLDSLELPFPQAFSRPLPL
jgi:hypothetical protein